MRKLFAGLFISLDGVTEAPYKWQFDNFDEDMMAAMESMLAVEDTVLLGRVTYQEWAPYWPTSTDEPFASFINNTPKCVVSTTLETVEWQNSTLIKGDLVQGIAALKQRPGNAIGVAGSPSLVRSLLLHDLLDELVLMVHPVVVGRGKRLFNEQDELKRLKLVDAKATRTGVLIATYQPYGRTTSS